MSAYLIFHYRILDRTRIDELGPLVEPVVEKYKGEIVIGDYVEAIEGTPYTHMVTYKFESKQLALAFYNSKEHQQLSQLRNDITEGTVMVVPEFGYPHE